MLTHTPTAVEPSMHLAMFSQLPTLPRMLYFYSNLYLILLYEIMLLLLCSALSLVTTYVPFRVLKSL
jgi:hypothetical protein